LEEEKKTDRHGEGEIQYNGKQSKHRLMTGRKNLRSRETEFFDSPECKPPEGTVGVTELHSGIGGEKSEEGTLNSTSLQNLYAGEGK